jgi:hypothetical protein
MERHAEGLHFVPGGRHLAVKRVRGREAQAFHASAELAQLPELAADHLADSLSLVTGDLSGVYVRKRSQGGDSE